MTKHAHNKYYRKQPVPKRKQAQVGEVVSRCWTCRELYSTHAHDHVWLCEGCLEVEATITSIRDHEREQMELTYG